MSMPSGGASWRVLATAATVVILIVGGAAATIISRRNPLRFEYATGALAPDAYAALAARDGWKAWTIPVSDGVTLNGLVHPPQSADAPWILFFPGNDPAQLATGQRAVETMIGANDWGGAVFAYRGFDGSGGKPTVDALRSDGSAALANLLESEHLGASQVHVTAFSIGGHVAAAVVGAQATSRAPVASLSLLASVNDIVMVRRSPVARVAAGDAFLTRPLLADVPAPVLVIQGADDEALGGPAQGRAIAAALGNRVEYVELAGVGHTVLLTNEVALRRVHDFIAARVVGSAP